MTRPLPALLPRHVEADPMLSSVWSALCEAADSADCDFTWDTVESMDGYEGIDVAWEFTHVAEALSQHAEFPHLAYTRCTDSVGVLSGFEVGVFRPAHGDYVMRYVDFADATVDRDGTGAAAAVGYGLVIAAEYEAAVAANRLHIATFVDDHEVVHQIVRPTEANLRAAIRECVEKNYNSPMDPIPTDYDEMITWLMDEGIDVHVTELTNA